MNQSIDGAPGTVPGSSLVGLLSTQSTAGWCRNRRGHNQRLQVCLNLFLYVYVIVITITHINLFCRGLWLINFNIYLFICICVFCCIFHVFFVFSQLTCSVEGVVILELERLLILATLPSEAFSAPAHQSPCQLSGGGNIENKLWKIQISKPCSFTDHCDRADFLASACQRPCVCISWGSSSPKWRSKWI